MVKFVDVGVLYFFLVWPEQEPPVAIRIFIFLFLAKFPEPGGGVAPRMARSPSPPSPFECPITMEIMSDPVVLTATGHTFERAAIESHLKQYSTCPMTNVEVTDCKLVPNYALKSVIDQEKKRKAGAAQHLSVGYAERVPSMPTPRMNRSPSPAASGKTAALSGVARQGSDVANGEKTAVQRGVWKGSGHTGGKPAAARSTANLCARVTEAADVDASATGDDWLLLMGDGDVLCPDADINKTVKTMMSKVPVAGPDSGPKRFAFAKKLRTLFGISDSVRCRTLLRRIKELAGKEVPTIRLVEERARGGSGRKVVLPNAVLPGGKHSFGALKVDKQYMKLLQDGLKYGLRSSHQCRHKCVCDDDCSCTAAYTCAMACSLEQWN